MTFAAASVLLGPRGPASGVGDCPCPGAVLSDLPLDLADGVRQEVLVVGGVERAGRASQRVAGNLHDLVAVESWLQVPGPYVQRNRQVESHDVFEESFSSVGTFCLRSSGQRPVGALAPLTPCQRFWEAVGRAAGIVG